MDKYGAHCWCRPGRDDGLVIHDAQWQSFRTDFGCSVTLVWFGDEVSKNDAYTDIFKYIFLCMYIYIYYMCGKFRKCK